MEIVGNVVLFGTCNSSSTSQQWVILKVDGDNSNNNIRICQRRTPDKTLPIDQALRCLHVFPENIPFGDYKWQAQRGLPKNSPAIKINNEARNFGISGYYPDPSQYWLMNSTTHQLVNVQHPKGCLTTRHFLYNPSPFLLECDGYGYESPNPQLPKHQSFHPVPALDKSGEKLCYDRSNIFDDGLD